jgi:hypothetical protein
VRNGCVTGADSPAQRLRRHRRRQLLPGESPSRSESIRVSQAITTLGLSRSRCGAVHRVACAACAASVQPACSGVAGTARGGRRRRSARDEARWLGEAQGLAGGRHCTRWLDAGAHGGCRTRATRDSQQPSLQQQSLQQPSLQQQSLNSNRCNSRRCNSIRCNSSHCKSTPSPAPPAHHAGGVVVCVVCGACAERRVCGRRVCGRQVCGRRVRGRRVRVAVRLERAHLVRVPPPPAPGLLASIAPPPLRKTPVSAAARFALSAAARSALSAAARFSVSAARPRRPRLSTARCLSAPLDLGADSSEQRRRAWRRGRAKEEAGRA